MFDNNDFEHIAKMQNEVADGFVDASDTHIFLEKVTDILANTRYESDEARMAMIMECINLCYEEEDEETVLVEDNMFGVILGLCFNYANVVTNLIRDGFNMKEYYDFLREEVLPEVREQSKNLPYWEMDDE